MANSNGSIESKEFALIHEISRSPAKNQRELSSRAGLSLGMTNLLLKRLVRKGYLKVKQLDWNKTQYLLTLKGSMEKARKSYAYALYTLEQARKITRAIQEAVIAEYREGNRRATVVAWPETAAIIRRALAEKDLPGFELNYVEAFKYLKPGTELVFTATLEPSPAPKAGQRFVPLLDRVDLEFRFDNN